MIITLPWPPSVNNYWVRTRHGGIMVSKRGRQFRAESHAIMLRQRVRKITGRAKLDIQAYEPDKRSRDLDNLLKAMLDALEHGGAVDNDSQFKDIRIWSAGLDRENPRVVVNLEAINREGD